MRSAITIGLLVFATIAVEAQAQGIDCGKARSAAEKAICASPALMALDRSIGTAYAAALAQHPDRAADLRRDLLRWLRTRDAACAVPAAQADSVPDRTAHRPPRRFDAGAGSETRRTAAPARATRGAGAVAGQSAGGSGVAGRRHLARRRRGRNKTARHRRRPLRRGAAQQDRRGAAIRRYADRPLRHQRRGRRAGRPARPAARCGHLQAARLFRPRRHRRGRRFGRCLPRCGAAARAAAAGASVQRRTARSGAARLLARRAARCRRHRRHHRRNPDRGGRPVAGRSAAVAQRRGTDHAAAGIPHRHAGPRPSAGGPPAGRPGAGRHLSCDRLWRPRAALGGRRRRATVPPARRCRQCPGRGLGGRPDRAARQRDFHRPRHRLAVPAHPAAGRAGRTADRQPDGGDRRQQPRAAGDPADRSRSCRGGRGERRRGPAFHPAGDGATRRHHRVQTRHLVRVGGHHRRGRRRGAARRAACANRGQDARAHRRRRPAEAGARCPMAAGVQPARPDHAAVPELLPPAKSRPAARPGRSA